MIDCRKTLCDFEFSVWKENRDEAEQQSLSDAQKRIKKDNSAELKKMTYSGELKCQNQV